MTINDLYEIALVSDRSLITMLTRIREYAHGSMYPGGRPPTLTHHEIAIIRGLAEYAIEIYYNDQQEGER